MPSVERSDPYAGYNFRIEIDGIEAGAFSEVSGLEAEVPVIEYRDGSDATSVRKLPGLPKYANITLKRGITGDGELWRWMKETLDGNVRRANGRITLLNEDREEVVGWFFRRGWPCKWVGPELAAKGNEVAIESLEIAHEGLELDD